MKLINNNIKLYGGPNVNYLDFELTLNRNIIFQYLYSITNNWFFVNYEPKYICNKRENYVSCSTKEKDGMA